jgi:hypothetical protein
MHQNRMELRTRISQAVGLVAAARRQWQWLAVAHRSPGPAGAPATGPGAPAIYTACEV